MVSKDFCALTRRGLCGTALAAGVVTALPRPSAATIRGRILRLVPPVGGAVDLDEAAIAALPWHDLWTHTVWTEGLQHFRGPRLADVLSPLAGTPFDLAERQLRITALNDFVVHVPASDAWAFQPLLAREMNGQTMRVRDKGPLWLVYPRDDMAVLRDPLMDERWIWQISRIEIL